MVAVDRGNSQTSGLDKPRTLPLPSSSRCEARIPAEVWPGMGSPSHSCIVGDPDIHAAAQTYLDFNPVLILYVNYTCFFSLLSTLPLKIFSNCLCQSDDKQPELGHTARWGKCRVAEWVMYLSPDLTASPTSVPKAAAKEESWTPLSPSSSVSRHSDLHSLH